MPAHQSQAEHDEWQRCLNAPSRLGTTVAVAVETMPASDHNSEAEQEAVDERCASIWRYRVSACLSRDTQMAPAGDVFVLPMHSAGKEALRGATANSRKERRTGSAVSADHWETILPLRREAAAMP